MSHNGKPKATVRDACRVLFRHKKKIVGFFIVTILLVATVIAAWPRKFRSEAKLFVRVGRETVTLDATATTGQTLPLQKTQESEINSVLEVIGGRSLFEKVVGKVGSERILGEDEPAAVGPTSALPTVSLSALLDPISDRERAVQQLQGSVTIWSPRGSSIIAIRCDTHHPRLALEIVAAFVDAYLSEHIRINRTSGSYEFFAEQANGLREELQEAANRLRDAKNQFGLVSVASQRDIVETHIRETESSMLRSDAALAASRARIDALQASTSALAEESVAGRSHDIPNPVADGMRQRLYDLELQGLELHSRYTDQHPEMKAIRRQVGDATQIAGQQEPRRTQYSTEQNPVRRQLRIDLLGEQSRAASLLAEANAARKQHEELLVRQVALNSQEVEIANLERQVQILEANYRTYSEKREQSRVEQALEHERISNVNVAEPATFVEKPVSPRIAIVALLGAVLAVSGGLGIAVISEQFDVTLRTPEEVAQALDLPVLAVLPRVSRRQLVFK